MAGKTLEIGMVIFGLVLALVLAYVFIFYPKKKINGNGNGTGGGNGNGSGGGNGNGGGTGNDTGGFLNIKNLSESGVVVYLDLKYPPCKKGTINCSWKNNDGVSYITDASGTRREIGVTARNQTLKTGEVWSVKVPLTNNKFEWCTNGLCTGAGGWVVPEGREMLAPESVMRFEFNWNGDAINYNLSGVDGINANMRMTYTGCSDFTVCNIPLTDCPFKRTVNGVNTCSAPKFKPFCTDNPETVNGVFKTDCEWMGCGFSSEPIKCRCHFYRKNNENGVKWDDYILNNNSGTCNIYSWAYGEFRPKPGKDLYCCSDVKDCCDYPSSARTPDQNACCNKSHDINCCQIDGCLEPTPDGPLLTCKYDANKLGSLNVDIIKVLK